MRRAVNLRVLVTPWLVSSSVISSSEQVARLRQRMIPRLVFRNLWGVMVVLMLTSDWVFRRLSVCFLVAVSIRMSPDRIRVTFLTVDPAARLTLLASMNGERLVRPFGCDVVATRNVGQEGAVDEVGGGGEKSSGRNRFLLGRAGHCPATSMGFWVAKLAGSEG